MQIKIFEGTQTWSQGNTYPILPRLNEFGIFEHQVNVSSSYGSENAMITNLQDNDSDLIFDLDLGNSTTDDIIDKTEINKINYNQDIELSLDKNLRLEVLTTNTPDTIEIDNTEQHSNAYQKIENYPSIKTKGVYPSVSIKQLGLDSDDLKKVFIGKLISIMRGDVFFTFRETEQDEIVADERAEDLFLFLLMNLDLKWWYDKN